MNLGREAELFIKSLFTLALNHLNIEQDSKPSWVYFKANMLKLLIERVRYAFDSLDTDPDRLAWLSGQAGLKHCKH